MQLLLAEGVVERQEIVGAYYVNEGSDGEWRSRLRIERQLRDGLEKIKSHGEREI